MKPREIRAPRPRKKVGRPRTPGPERRVYHVGIRGQERLKVEEWAKRLSKLSGRAFGPGSTILFMMRKGMTRAQREFAEKKLEVF